ncbi:MAG TPA: hypothetical protein VMJ66_11450, partial [Geobacteraceae bacterium]|nr:hypothetical protein [Geobacteraceae bacterium]
MKVLFTCVIILMLAFATPFPAMAGVDVSIGISLPPPIVFPSPPPVIVMPEASDVYVAPNVNVDLFFWNGWWWRPWRGGWYRSHYYDRGWAFYNNVPSFYYDVDPGWRGFYRAHAWYGHPWNYALVPHQELVNNWRSWHDTRRWEHEGSWGIQNYQPRPLQERHDLRLQRQAEYQRRPEVLQFQKQHNLTQMNKQHLESTYKEPQFTKQNQLQGVQSGGHQHYKLDDKPRVEGYQNQPHFKKVNQGAQFQNQQHLKLQNQPRVEQYQKPQLEQHHG